jgi:hypothetical protein
VSLEYNSTAHAKEELMSRSPHKMLLIHIDERAAPPTISCHPDPLHVRFKDTLRIHCEEKNYKVEFNKNGTPCNKNIFTGSAGVPTLPEMINKNPTGSVPLLYLYKATLFEGGSTIGSIDPVIIVDPYPRRRGKRHVKGKSPGSTRKSFKKKKA